MSFHSNQISFSLPNYTVIITADNPNYSFPHIEEAYLTRLKAIIQGCIEAVKEDSSDTPSLDFRVEKIENTVDVRMQQVVSKTQSVARKTFNSKELFLPTIIPSIDPNNRISFHRAGVEIVKIFSAEKMLLPGMDIKAKPLSWWKSWFMRGESQ